MVSLKKITWDNFNEVMKLKVKDEQSSFVASISYSLAQAYVALTNNDKPPYCFAIYNDDVLIGHTLFMYYPENSIYGDDASYVINRFFIDEAYQGCGFGREALAAILALIKTFPQGRVNSLYLSYNINNHIARNLYYQFGFIDSGRYLANGEMIARLDLNK